MITPLNAPELRGDQRTAAVRRPLAGGRRRRSSAPRPWRSPSASATSRSRTSMRAASSIAELRGTQPARRTSRHVAPSATRDRAWLAPRRARSCARCTPRTPAPPDGWPTRFSKTGRDAVDEDQRGHRDPQPRRAARRRADVAARRRLGAPRDRADRRRQRLERRDARGRRAARRDVRVRGEPEPRPGAQRRRRRRDRRRSCCSSTTTSSCRRSSWPRTCARTPPTSFPHVVTGPIINVPSADERPVPTFLNASNAFFCTCNVSLPRSGLRCGRRLRRSVRPVRLGRHRARRAAARLPACADASPGTPTCGTSSRRRPRRSTRRSRRRSRRRAWRRSSCAKTPRTARSSRPARTRSTVGAARLLAPRAAQPLLAGLATQRARSGAAGARRARARARQRLRRRAREGAGLTPLPARRILARAARRDRRRAGLHAADRGAARAPATSWASR